MPQSIITVPTHFTGLANSELHRVNSSIVVRSKLCKNTFLIEHPCSFSALGRHWLKQPPIYIQHICPVDHKITLSGKRQDLQTIQHEITKALILNLLQPNLSLSVQTRRRTRCVDYEEVGITQAIEELVSSGSSIKIDDTNPQQIVSVLICRVKRQIMAYIGYSLTEMNISKYKGGWPAYPRDESRLNRAELKLMEAIEEFDLRLKPGKQALDLGSAFGGWVRILRQHGLHVTTVDPVDRLDQKLHQDPKVQYFNMYAEDYLKIVEHPFDMITNDMIMDGQDSARLMVKFAPYLRRKGIAIMTLKLRNRHKRSVMDHSFRILRQAYRIVRVRHLFYNRSEITLVLHRK